MSSTILQIVPRAPGNREGVGDYAHTLAEGLRLTRGYETTFVAAEATSDSEILSPLAALSDDEWRQRRPIAIILHYVNYGYQRRGIPWRLPGKLRRMKELCGASLITIFHELYASSSWAQSAFWLQPLQKRIARAIAQESAACIVSSATLGEQLHQLAPRARIVVRPVVSNFGEPTLSLAQMTARDPQKWAICGGTELIRRSLRSFSQLFRGAAELFVIGGADRADIRELLEEQKEISSHYFPNVEAEVASEILASCAFGWIDYFEHAHVPTAAILKSTAFAAYCAHAVIPVFPSLGSPIALGDDRLPGPFSLGNLPPAAERPTVAQATYDWYGRNASSTHLAESIATVLAPSLQAVT